MTNTTTRTQILDTAKQAINVDRAGQYGSAEDGFAAIEQIWSALDKARGPRDRGPVDVALYLNAVKMVRAATNPQHADTWTDLCGYSALGGELAAIADECPECGRAVPCAAWWCHHPRAMRGRVE